jgi:hypothetical protein
MVSWKPSFREPLNRSPVIDMLQARLADLAGEESSCSPSVALSRRPLRSKLRYNRALPFFANSRSHRASHQLLADVLASEQADERVGSVLQPIDNVLPILQLSYALTELPQA